VKVRLWIDRIVLEGVALSAVERGQLIEGLRSALAIRLRERAAHKERLDSDGKHVGREVVHLSTTPTVQDGQLVPRPFTVRVFAARDGDGRWTVMPGGFARLADDSDVRATVMGEAVILSSIGVE